MNDVEPSSSPRPLLILRPQPAADITVGQAQERGLHATAYPLFTVLPLAWDAPDATAFDAVMLTSANSLRHSGDALSLYLHLPVFAVGNATATAAKARGFRDITVAGPDIIALMAAIQASPHRRVLHIGGKHLRPCDPGDIIITRRAVYEATDTGNSENLAAHLTGNPVLLVHSPRAGKRAASLIPPERKQAISIIAISPNALAAAGGGWHRGIAVTMPDDALMLDMAEQMCQM